MLQGTEYAIAKMKTIRLRLIIAHKCSGAVCGFSIILKIVVILKLEGDVL